MDVGEQYLQLVLRLRSLLPELVESYVGPPELATVVEAEPPPAAEALREQAEDLMARVGEAESDHDRRGWLQAQLSAISTALAWLAGERFTYRELVARCHGVAVTPVPEEQFTDAHESLARALPGRGEVRERYQRWNRAQRIPREKLLPGLRALADELRGRTSDAFGLPAGEEVVFELVSGRHFAGNADYQGSLRTRIAINEDLPITGARLLELVSHEAYPGHHTEHACKDARLVDERGYAELGAYVYPTPQALISEGIACHALEALLGDEAEEVAARCLQPLGIPFDVETARAVREAGELLLGVRPNIAIMLDEGDVVAEDVHAYARRWLLDDDRLVARSLEGLQARAWRPYESCYPAGLELCRRYAAGDTARFGELLHRQLTPGQLGSDTSHGRSGRAEPRQRSAGDADRQHHGSGEDGRQGQGHD